ncbi:MAG: 3-oxoacyl-ACP reductase FabG [Aeromonadales bacterium]|nr:3-oxoacyl-ACP reductase FabG [Aeromonadales bacterium]MDY2890810.1 3-oxoacyl-ACP reductase FabG [Succinivibrio sp.]
MNLTGKHAIVTGGSSGIGQGIAQKLAKEGAYVSIFDNANCDKTMSLIFSCGKHACFYSVDISKPQEVIAAFQDVIKKNTSLEILVNCAGINRDAMCHKMTYEQWHEVIDVDLNGTFYCTQQAVIHMRQRSYGRIINISSGSWLGNIGQANYAAAKAGIIGLTKTVARENAKHRITCNAICPGFIETPMTLKLKTIKDGAPWDSMISRIPMGHAGKPEDVAAMVAFLASDDAAYITAEVINVGGGMFV